MARALWTGSLSSGSSTCPCSLISAVRDLDLHFRQIHEKDDTPIETHRVCSKEGKEVPYEEIGNEYDGVVVTDEELSAADPAKTRTIDIESFVKLEEIDPIYFDHPYYLVPAGETDGTVRAYRLLAGVMEQHRPRALGRFVLRTKEYLVAIRVREQALTLSTHALPRRGPRHRRHPRRGRAHQAKEVKGAVKMIEAMSGRLGPGRTTRTSTASGCRRSCARSARAARSSCPKPTRSARSRCRT